MVRQVYRGGLSVEWGYDDDNGDFASWTSDGEYPHVMKYDTKYVFDREFTPNFEREITPFPYQEAKVDYTIKDTQAHMETIAPDWAKDFIMTYQFELSAGEKKIELFAGDFTCEICMAFRDNHNAFDLTKPWSVSITSDEIYMWLIPVVRYLMPVGNNVAMARFRVVQAFSLLKLLPTYKISIMVKGHVINRNATDGRPEPKDRMRADMAVSFERMGGRITLNGFDSLG